MADNTALMAGAAALSPALLLSNAGSISSLLGLDDGDAAEEGTRSAIESAQKNYDMMAQLLAPYTQAGLPATQKILDSTTGPSKLGTMQSSVGTSLLNKYLAGIGIDTQAQQRTTQKYQTDTGNTEQTQQFDRMLDLIKQGQGFATSGAGTIGATGATTSGLAQDYGNLLSSGEAYQSNALNSMLGDLLQGGKATVGGYIKDQNAGGSWV
jgi:hypothetical protein